MITCIHRVSLCRTAALKRVARFLFVAFAGALSTTVTATACDFHAELPGYNQDFVSANTGDFRMMIWERLGGAKFNATQKTEIPIHLSFTPILGYQTSPILGQGFRLMPFDATFVQKDGDTFEMTQPSGYVSTLGKTRNPHVLKGEGWMAKVSGSGAGQVVTAESSCGWTIIYNAGRLARMTSPDKEIFDFLTDPAGSRQVNRNGRKLMTLRRDFDPKTTLPLWHLDFSSEDGPKHGILKIGYRKILVTLPTKATREEGRRALASIQFDNEPERRYNFKIDELDRAEHVYKWDPTTYQLLAKNGMKYEFTKILGINCFKTVYPDGKQSLRGHSRNGRMAILQDRYSLPELVEYIASPVKRMLAIRKISQINPDGSLELITQYWYDENGTIIRSFVKDLPNGLKYERNRNVVIAYTAQKENPIWKKIYDEQERLKEFHQGEKTYHFNYLNDNEVQVSAFNRGQKIKDAILTMSKIAHLTQNPTLY